MICYYLRFVVCALGLFDASDDEALSVNVLLASSTDAMQCHCHDGCSKSAATKP